MSQSFNCLIRRVPGRFWFAVGGCLLAAFWVQQHDARIRQQAGLQQLRNETSAQVAALRRQAAEDVRQANVTNAEAVAKLEQRRQEAEQQDRQLAAQLDRLRKQAQIQADEVATLPISEIVTRVAAQLGLKAEDVAAGEGAFARKGAKAQRKLQIMNYELQTPHPVPPGASTLSPRRGLASATSVPREEQSTAENRRGPGTAQAADIAKGAISAPPMNYELPEAGSSADIAKGAISAPPGVTTAAGGQSPPLQNQASLALTASGARKVEASLVALDACRAKSDIQARQVSNCQARAAADEAAIARLNGSVASLNQALQAKDKVLVEQQSEYKAELRAARGTFLGRLARLTEHVAIGVGVGVAIGVAVK
ncbi:MAG TPA: hypothetical protein VFQ24_11660 [Terriglobia bacterium]|nr:hypothetical protein [Terriglobia bacterium]